MTIRVHSPAELVHRLPPDRPSTPRILALAEPAHGVETSGEARNDVVEYLVDHAGYRTIALESDAWAGRLVDAWVRGGPGSESDVLARGISHGFGASPANRELLRWARERNRGRDDADRVGVTGFDGPMEMTHTPSPRATLLHLHAYLDGRDTELGLPCDRDTLDRLLGADEPWTDTMAMLDPARSVGGQERVRELRALADDLARTLAVEAPALHRAADPGLDDAELAARTATALLAHHAAMASPAGDRAARLCALRDLLMADNAEALARRGPVLLCAHHAHLRTGTATMPWGGVTIAGVDIPATTLRWQPAGAHLAGRLGDEYAVVATTSSPRDDDVLGQVDAVLAVGGDQAMVDGS